MENDRVERLSVILILLSLFVFALYVIRPLLDAVIVSAFFAYIASPLTDWLETKIKNRTAAAIIVVILAIMPFVFLSVQIIQLYSNEFYKLSTISLNLPMKNYINWDTLYTKAIEDIRIGLNPEVILQSIGAGIELVIKIFIILAGSFYMLRDRYHIRKFLLSLVPVEKKSISSSFLDISGDMLYGIFLGYLVTSLLVGGIAGIGYYLIGLIFGVPPLMNYPILIGSFTAVAVLLPIIGAWLVYMPMSITLFAFGNITASIAVFIFGFFALTIIPDLLLRPYISGRYGKTHPFIVLLGFISGPIVFGPIGLILGPAFLSLFEAALRTYREKIEKDN